MKAKIFLSGLVLLAGLAFASGQNPVKGNGNGNNGTCNGTGKGSAFVDTNKNGICDTYENRTANTAVRKGKGNGNGNCNGAGAGKGLGQGKGQGLGNGQGKGKNFVDANQNGVCDTYEARNKK